MKRKENSKHKNFNSIILTCEFCKDNFYESPSKAKRKKRHFCSMECYAEFRKFIPLNEQPNYKNIRQEGESKQVYHRRYIKAYPEKIAHLKARGYARKKNAEGSHSLEEWNNLKEKHQHKCAICNENKPLTKDHIIPLSKEGSDYINNIQPLCRNCNSKKHNKIL